MRKALASRKACALAASARGPAKCSSSVSYQSASQRSKCPALSSAFSLSAACGWNAPPLYVCAPSSSVSQNDASDWDVGLEVQLRHLREEVADHRVVQRPAVERAHQCSQSSRVSMSR